jgi:hypothetical protein
MKKVWILGAGKFGQIATETLRRKHADAEITMVEKSETVCRKLTNTKDTIICRDGIEFLKENLKMPDEPDWIIPVIPVHVAFEWIKARLPAGYRLAKLTIPDRLAISLPNPCRGKRGELYISHADFICPDNCSQARDKCTHTGKPKPMRLYEMLESLEYGDFEPIVVRSWQLSPGVGGVKPHALFQTLNKVLAGRNPLLLSTACGCHGVMDAFKISRP